MAADVVAAVKQKKEISTNANAIIKIVIATKFLNSTRFLNYRFSKNFIKEISQKYKII